MAQPSGAVPPVAVTGVNAGIATFTVPVVAGTACTVASAVFTVSWNVPWDAKDELKEYICQENNRFLQKLTDDFGEPIFGKRP